MRFAQTVALAAALASAAAVHADTVTTFNLVGATLSNLVPTTGTASGTVTIDTTTGMYTAADVTINFGGSTFVFDQPITSGEQGFVYHSSEYDFYINNAAGDFLNIGVPEGLVGFQGDGVCSYATFCDFDFTSSFSEPSGTGADFETGTLVAAATPEPSSLLLLSTGLLGAAAFLIRKRAKTTP